MSDKITVGIMDRATDPPKWKGTFVIEMDRASHTRGDKAARRALREKIAKECDKRKLHVESVSSVHQMPKGLPECDCLVTVLSHDVSRAFAAKRVKTRPVMRGGKPIQGGHDVGVPTNKPTEE